MRRKNSSLKVAKKLLFHDIYPAAELGAMSRGLLIITGVVSFLCFICRWNHSQQISQVEISPIISEAATPAPVKTNFQTAPSFAPEKLALTERIEAATSSDFPHLLNEISCLTDTKLRRQLLARLTERWVQVSPSGFKDFCKELARGDEEAIRLLPLLGEAMVDLSGKISSDFFYPLAGSYATVNLREATEWSGQVVATGHDIFPCVEMFGKMVVQDPQEAVKMVMALPHNPVRALVVEHLAYHWDFNDYNGAMAVVAQLPGDEKGHFISEFFRGMTSANPAQAAKILTSSTDPLILQSAAGSVGETYMNFVGPKAAMEWADGLPTADGQRSAVMAIYNEWSIGDPVEALNDAQSRYPQNPELAAGFFENAVTGRNDSQIIDQLAKVTDPMWQCQAYLGAFQSMLKFETLGVLDQELGGLQTGDARDHALAAFAVAASSSAPEMAWKWAKQISNPALSTATLGDLKTK